MNKTILNANTSCAAALIAGLVLVVLLNPIAAQTPAAVKPDPESCSGKPLDAVLKKVSAFKYGRDRAPLVQLADCVREAGNTPALQPELEKRLGAFLQERATEDGHRHVCEQLGVIGTAASVPVLSGMLLNPAAAEMARYALERIQAPAAGEALLAALPIASNEIKIGIATSLGKRRERQSAPALSKLLEDPDAAVVLAAAAALGSIADDPSRQALSQAREKSSGIQRAAITDAYLRSLDQLVREGRKQEAFDGYRALVRREESGPVIIAAARGIIACTDIDLTPQLAQAFELNDPDVHAEAIWQLAAKGTPQAVDVLKTQYPKLPARSRVQVLAALAQKGVPGIMPLFLQAARDEDAEVRAAALQGLGRVGDSTCVLMLAETAAASGDPEQSAARYALAALRGPQVNPLLFAGLESANPKLKVELIRAIGDRSAPGAAAALVKMLQDADGKVRRESLRSLRESAESSHIPDLLKFLAATQDANERSDAERTIAATLKRHDMGITPVLSLYSPTMNLPVRLSLLAILGMMGDQQGQPALQASLKETQEEVRRAAVAALSDWPNDEPAGSLLLVAGEKPAESLQIVALRGYIRLVGLPSRRGNVMTVAMLGSALAVATRAEEKKAILAQLQRFPCPEALAMAKKIQKDKTVAAEANLAITAIQTRLTAARR